MRRSDFDSSIDLKLIFQEMSAGKGETKKKKGLTWAEAAKQVLKVLYGHTKKSMSAECEVMCSLLDVILPELSYFFVALGIGEVG